MSCHDYTSCHAHVTSGLVLMKSTHIPYMGIGCEISAIGGALAIGCGASPL